MILATLTGMDALELALTSVGVLGLLTTIGLLAEAARDLAVLEQTPTFQPGGARDLIARGRVAGLIYTISMLLVLIAVSSVLLLIPDRASGLAGTIRRGIQSYALMFIELTLVVASLLMRRDSIRILERIHAQPKALPAPKREGDGDDAARDRG